MNNSSFLDLEVLCSNCKNLLIKPVRVFDIEGWSKESSKTITTHCWCEFCRSAIAYRYKFISDENGTLKAEVKEYLSSDKVLSKMKIRGRTGITVRPKLKTR